MQDFIIDNPYQPWKLEQLLWGKSHYFDDSTRRFFRARLCESTTITEHGGCDFTLLLTRETMGAGFSRRDGREHKVCLFNSKGNCKVVFKGTSKVKAKRAYEALRAKVITIKSRSAASRLFNALVEVSE